MKCRLYSKAEKGIALVITLVMLAIVTVMAIVFLGVSRRERASVKLVEDIATANAMADAAAERAKAEAIAKMAAEGSRLYYDLFNSRSFQTPNGFNTSQSAGSLPDPSNVNYVDKTGKVLTGAPYLRMLANMQYDPRVPVFIETNTTTGATEFRYFLDFDRNRLVETNGVLPLLDDNGNQITAKNPVTGAIEKQSGDLVGDPEWIGVLERPDLPHSETNRFIGRLAYLVLPAGKTLDVNFIHNQANRSAPDRIDLVNTANGFTRNEGVGSWEINLAAFFRELSPTNWPRATYNFRPGQLPTGAAFDDARALLAFRYNTRQFLKNANSALSLNPENFGNQNIFDQDGIDEYGDGPLPVINQSIFRPRVALTERENDTPAITPWPGSLNTNAFTDLQQMFNVASQDFTNRLETPLRRRNSSDRYQFYRMAAQLGVDSVPALTWAGVDRTNRGKLHLNFLNAPGKITNTFLPWAHPKVSPLAFFTNAADLMLKASIDGTVVVASNRNSALQWGRQPGTYYLIGDTLVSTNFSLNNIQVYAPYKPAAGTNFPTLRQNEYSPAIHRVLQVAANIYDSMTNRGPTLEAARGIYFPTVFHPVFTKTATNIYISDWREITNVSQVANATMDFEELYRTNRLGALTNPIPTVFGEHLVIGAKKGHPNFNEMSLQTTAEVTRKLEVVKTSIATPPTATNEMFIVDLAQRWGMEAWNSYTNLYRHGVTIMGQVFTTAAIKDGTNLLQAPIQMWSRPITGLTNMANWGGTTNTANFVVVLSNNYALLADAAYTRLGGFRPTNIAQFTPIEAAPRFVVTTTNRVRYLMWDRATRRVLDYVSFDNLVVTTDIGSVLYTNSTPSAGQFAKAHPGDNEDVYWDPTPVPGHPNITKGITNQLAAASGEIPTTPNIWKAFRFSTPLRQGQKAEDDKNGAIAVWRRFLGMKLLATDPPVGIPTDLRMQIPFVPSRKIEQIVSWQVNDPLVHYMAQDIAPDPLTSAAQKVPLISPQSGQVSVAAGLPPSLAHSAWNIGQWNTRYDPWGGTAQRQPTARTFSVGVKDPGIRKSDDWEFPIDDLKNEPNHFFANVGELGRVHRGTPWQTIYLKSVYTNQITANGVNFQQVGLLPGLHPTDWIKWAGTAGTHPMHDWQLIDVFTTAPNENAARGLLSVNQTNRAAWSAVLSGVIVATNVVSRSEAAALGDFKGSDPVQAFHATYVEPATPQVQLIVDSINAARQRQLTIFPNPTSPTAPWDFAIQRNLITGKTNNVFTHLGDVLGAPHLTVQSPFLNQSTEQVKSVLTDRAMEYIPQQILSLLQRDEPRFVVYAFGQSLKPAPKSLTSDPNYFHMCTNYQITGEVTTKTVFRVEGDLPIPGDTRTANNTLRAVVESYEILPPVE